MIPPDSLSEFKLPIFISMSISLPVSCGVGCVTLGSDYVDPKCECLGGNENVSDSTLSDEEVIIPVKPKQNRYYSSWSDEKKHLKASQVISNIVKLEARLDETVTPERMKKLIDENHGYLRCYYVKWYVKLSGEEGYMALLSESIIGRNEPLIETKIPRRRGKRAVA
jgi:hypothetical protein